MAIVINIDVMLAKRKMSVTELSERVGITMANISILKNGKAKAIKVNTLDGICRALDCQPGDILEYGRECPETISREQHSPAAVPEECADIPGDPHIPPPDIGIGNVALQ